MFVGTVEIVFFSTHKFLCRPKISKEEEDTVLVRVENGFHKFPSFKRFPVDCFNF